jgi:hypothetical protein
MPVSKNLPNFVHFGTPKSGSATLSDLLTRHPQIYAPRPKELNFFNTSVQYAKGVEWYLESYFADYTGQPVICDKSIGYSAGNPEQTMDRIVSALGRDFRILLTVRNPVDRAYSQYCMARYKGQIESSDFVSAVQSALQAHGQYSLEDLRRAVDEQGYYRDARNMAIYRDAFYLVPGQYARLLELCQTAVGAENVLVLFTEDMGTDLPTSLRKLTDFLDIDAIEVEQGFRRNEATALRFPWLRRAYNKLYAIAPIQRAYRNLGISARKALRRKLLSWNYKPNNAVPAMPVEARRLLQTYYAAESSAFGEMIGRDLSHWLTPPPERDGT